MTPDVFVQMCLKAWNIQISRTDKFFSSVSDDVLLKEIAPGRNTNLYLMGHLIAVNDSMISLFSKGERQYSHYDEAFLKNPDRSGFPMPDAATLRAEWKKSNDALNAIFNAMTAEEWFGKHTAMTQEDLDKEPGRNKLSVLINRTNHVAYHLGQLLIGTRE